MTTIESIEDFLRENAEKLCQMAERRSSGLGFNAFALMSDTYKRENFHSDVIRAILDPNAQHGEGTLFLRKFVEFLAKRARQIGNASLHDRLSGLSFENGKILVTREEGRIDVKIKAPGWTIIIENKINGALDMERQLPRYVEECEKQGENVVAVVYLKAGFEGRPIKNGWKSGDDEMVDEVLIPVAGYSRDKTVLDLVGGWLKPCEQEAENFNVKAVISQYSELVKKLAGDSMTEEECKEILNSITRNRIPYSCLLEALYQVPYAAVAQIVEAFKDEPGLEGVTDYPDEGEAVAVIPFKPVLVGGEPFEYGFDIVFSNQQNVNVSFFFRIKRARDDDYNPPRQVLFLDVLQAADRRFMILSPDGTGRAGFSCVRDEVFADFDGFVAVLRTIVDTMVRDRGRLEELARRSVNSSL